MNKKNKLSDAILIEKYQKGNPNALTHLVKRWHLKFCNFAFWIVKDKDVAKDIAQETWTIILHKLNDLQEPEKFKSWAISIVNRKAIDFLRANNREHKKLENFYNENTTNLEELGDELNKLHQEKKILNIEIEKLPINQKQVLILFYRENYSLKEISSFLKISVGTTKSRLFHAREKLKSIIKK